MSIDVKSIRRSLAKKGFEEKTGDHIRYRLMCDGKFMGVTTEVSHGKSYQIAGKLRSLMARQLMLSTKDFDRLVDCSLDGETYMDMVKQKLADGESSRRRNS